MHLACVMFRMSLPEALAAATINAAGSLGKSDLYGSLEVGKFGDMVVIDSAKYDSNYFAFHHSILKKEKKSSYIDLERSNIYFAVTFVKQSRVDYSDVCPHETRRFVEPFAVISD